MHSVSGENQTIIQVNGSVPQTHTIPYETISQTLTGTKYTPSNCFSEVYFILLYCCSVPYVVMMMIFTEIQYIADIYLIYIRWWCIRYF